MSAYVHGCRSTRSSTPGQDSLEPQTSDQFSCPSSNDLQPLADSKPTDPTPQPCVSDLDQPSWSSSNDLQPLANSTPTNPIPQPHASDQPIWSSFNDLQPSPDSSPADPIPQPYSSDLNQPSWSSSNDLRPLVDPTSAILPLQLWQPGIESLSPHVLKPNWSSSNDLQPGGNGSPAHPSLQPLQPGLASHFLTACAPTPSGWSGTEYHQRLTVAATGNLSMQSPPSEFVWPQRTWSGSNDLIGSAHF